MRPPRTRRPCAFEQSPWRLLLVCTAATSLSVVAVAGGALVAHLR